MSGIAPDNKEGALGEWHVYGDVCVCGMSEGEECGGEEVECEQVFPPHPLVVSMGIDGRASFWYVFQVAQFNGIEVFQAFYFLSYHQYDWLTIIG